MGGEGGLLDNQIFLPCIKSSAFVPFYSACTLGLGEWGNGGGGGATRQSDIPPCIKFPTFVPICK